MNLANLLKFFTPLYVKIIAYLVCVAIALGSVYYALHTYYAWAYTNGVTSTTAQWTARENIQFIAANSKIVQLENEARQKELEQGIQVANIVDTYEKEKQNATNETAIIISKLNAGTIRLRDKYATRGQSTCPSATSATSTNPTSDSEEAGAELSQTTAKFLFELTSEADEVVLQLQACQALLITDRLTCNVTHIVTAPLAQ